METVWSVFLWLFGGVGLVIAGGVWNRLRRRPSDNMAPTWSIADPSLEQLKQRAKLLVVDDSTFDFLKPLRDHGFTVEWKKDLSSTQAIDAGEYDVVLLDLHGVGASLSDDQGIGLLRQIKNASPAQVVIAYSSAAWTLGQSERLAPADHVLDKATAGFPEFRTAILENLAKSADLDFYVDLLIQQSAPTRPNRLLLDLKESIRQDLLAFVSSGSSEDLKALEQRLAGLDQEVGIRHSATQAVAQLARKRLKPWLKAS